MVNSQTMIFLKTEHSVIPPGITLLRLLKKSEGVQRKKILKGLTLLGGHQNVAFPALGIPNVTVIRGDIKVA